jgi:hypothetical protein
VVGESVAGHGFGAGEVSAPNRNREWIAASRAFRVRALFTPVGFEVIEEYSDHCCVGVGEVET